MIKKMRPGKIALSIALATATWLSPLAVADTEAPKVEKLTFEQIRKQLLRKTGQTQFLDLQYVGRASSARGLNQESAAMADAPGGAGGEKRDVVESDVFAIDPTTKKLYLLTGDRGLITLNEKDEIVGRSAASGNRPDMMFVFSDRKKLLVIEQDWEKAYEDQSVDASQANTKLVQYDISTDRPTIDKVVALEGTVVDTRVVGKVLYLTSSVYPTYNRWGWGWGGGNRSEQPKGRVYSIKLETLDTVAQVDSQLPAGNNNMIRIVEQQTEEGKYKYFALAVSPQMLNDFSWWRRASQVEVFDITNAEGTITPLFRAGLKGNVQKATQVTLSGEYLVAVSNYSSNPKDFRAPWRLAAESFKLPTSTDKVIKRVEADYRLDQIKTRAETLSADEQEEGLEKLYTDASIGLKNVFVRLEDGSLTKYLPDSIETSGDITGLSANLRDVRFNPIKNGLEIYSFWVPQNNIDPFDLFVMSTDGKITYSKRLQYDGWAERAIPFDYDGKKLILSLGYIIPPTETQGRRFPQALLFEVRGNGSKAKLDLIEDITLKNQNLWANTQGEDKLITFNFDKKTGKGAILFPVYGYSAKQGSFSGGKIVGFDLNKLDSEEKAFKDGALILGDSGWMKRVFEDSRSQVLHTFSDSELATFPSFADALNTTEKKLDAIRRVELARDMITFLPVADGMGLQVVRRGQMWGENTGTQLRLVKRTDPDTDVTKITSKLDIAGQYSGHYGLKDGKFLLFTVRGYHKPGAKEGQTIWTTEFGAHLVNAQTTGQSPKITLESSTVWEENNKSPRIGTWGSDPATTAASVTSFGKYLIWNAGNRLFQVDSSDLSKIQLKTLEIAGLPSVDQVYYTTLINLGDGNLALSYSLPVQVESKAEERASNLSVTRNFAALLEVSADGSAVQIKGNPVNIPGRALSLETKKSASYLITSDNAVTDIIEESENAFRANQSPYLQSLNLGKQEASLVDSLRSNELSPEGFKRIANLLVTLKAETTQNFGPVWRGVMAMDAPMGRGFMPRRFGSQSNATLAIVQLDDSGRLSVDTRVLPRYELPGRGSLLGALAVPGSSNKHLLAIGSGSRIQVYDFQTDTLELKARGLNTYDEYNTKSKDTALMARIPGTGRWYYWGWYGSSNPSLSIDPDGSRVYISMGMSGVFALDVGDAPAIPKQEKPTKPEVQKPVSSTPLP